MVTASTKLILPIPENEAAKLVDKESFAQWVKSTGRCSLAATYGLLRLPALIGKSDPVPVIEKSLAQLVPALQSQEASEQVRDVLKEQWIAETWEEALRLIESLGISLLKDGENNVIAELDSTGEWDFELTARLKETRNPLKYSYERPSGEIGYLGELQNRVFSQYLAEPDESLNLQACAGSGKTHIAKLIVERLNPMTTLVLAMTQSQLKGLMGRIGAQSAVGHSFGSIARIMFERMSGAGRSALSGRTGSTFQRSDHDVGALMGFMSVSGMPPAVVARTVRRIVMAFCQSSATHFLPEHLPRLYEKLNRADTYVLLEYASRYWDQLFDATVPGLQIPVRGYHIIKYVSLTNEVIPEEYENVVIDESHELTPAMLAILDRSPQAVLTLGDKYQRLSGWMPTRKTQVRHREINVTLRAGRQIESLLNPVLGKHPDDAKEPIRGSDHRRTHISYYSRPQVPDHPTTILVGTDFHVLEWFQRLAAEGASFDLLDGSKYLFSQFVSGLIDLYQHQTRSDHPYLFRYPTWRALEESHHGNTAFQRIHGMLRRGYGYRDFQNSLEKMQSVSSPRIHLGKVEHAKNLEFDSIMLAPELLSGVEEANKLYLAETLSRIYTASTRARFEVIAPGILRDWLDDQSALRPLLDTLKTS